MIIKIILKSKKDLNKKMPAKIDMSLDEMELFFQLQSKILSITSVQSRPKRLRKDSKMIRSAQRRKICKIQEDIQFHTFSSTMKFLTSILTTGCSDEGTPV